MGYRVPFCSVCRSKYNKLQNESCHKLCEEYLMETDEEYKRIYKLRQIKKSIDCIRYSSKRKVTEIETQNEHIRRIFDFFCEYLQNEEDIVDANDLMLRESDMNNEIGIDWWQNKGDYRTMYIRNMLFLISTSFHRREHDEYMRLILNEYFAENTLKFAELLRLHLMEAMNPKNYNRKYPAFEILYHEQSVDAVGDDQIFDPDDDNFVELMHTKII